MDGQTAWIIGTGVTLLLAVVSATGVVITVVSRLISDVRADIRAERSDIRSDIRSLQQAILTGRQPD